MAVATDDPPKRDKRIENTRLVPIVLDLVTPRDIDNAIATAHSLSLVNEYLDLIQQLGLLSNPSVSLAPTPQVAPEKAPNTDTEQLGDAKVPSDPY